MIMDFIKERNDVKIFFHSCGAEEAGLSDQVKIMIGGAGTTQDFADAIGTDGYAQDASAAVCKAKELLAITA